MFVYTLRASTMKFFSIVGVALIALVSLILFLPNREVATTGVILAQREKLQFDKIKTNEDRLAFLAQFGWEAEETPTEEVTLTIPTEFDKIMKSYNELQKQQGLDVSKYKGKTVERYTYEIKNYPDYDGRVLASILVYKNRVIGGDICSSDIEGFIHGLTRPQ